MIKRRKLKGREHRYITQSGRIRISRSKTKKGEERFKKKYNNFVKEKGVYSSIDLENVKSVMLKKFKDWASGSYVGKDKKIHRNFKGYNNMSFGDIENSFRTKKMNIESDGTFQIGSEGTHTKLGKRSKSVFKLRMNKNQTRIEIYIRGKQWN